jgi:hypothetical protein
MRELLGKFVQAINSEIALIEKDGGERSYELLSGQREEKSNGTLYVFLLADALRLLRTSGNLVPMARTPASSYPKGNRVWLLLESTRSYRRIFLLQLVVNETELLKKLKEKIEELSASGEFGLGSKLFGLDRANVFFEEPPELDDRVAGQTREARAQCIGSEVTFLWGPPGTGKTFTIAALVASLAQIGETVLVTSHTHAAVEQALWALVEDPAEGRRPGYLHGSQLMDDGRILKVGVPKSDKIPAKVCLDKYLEEKARERAENIAILEEEAERTADRLGKLTLQNGPWVMLREAENDYERTAISHGQAAATSVAAATARDGVRTEVRMADAVLDQARRSFFVGRNRRVENATRNLATARRRLQTAEAEAGTAEAQALRGQTALGDAQARVIRARQAVEGLLPAAELESAIKDCSQYLEGLRGEIQALKASGDGDAKEIVRNAVAVFATLTKLYRDQTSSTTSAGIPSLLMKHRWPCLHSRLTPHHARGSASSSSATCTNSHRLCEATLTVMEAFLEPTSSRCVALPRPSTRARALTSLRG